VEIRLDCDNDVPCCCAIEQVGGHRLPHRSAKAASSRNTSADGRWSAVDPVLKDPKEIYK
jgi:phosphoribosyl-AMP cyclohydrolase